ncbi:hypothetical protein V6N13_072269 [Hibiscus sabdariffa]
MAVEWERLKVAENLNLFQRLKAFNGFLKGWNLSSFGNVDRGIQRVMSEIEQLEGNPLEVLNVSSMVEKNGVCKVNCGNCYAIGSPFGVKNRRCCG